MYHPTSRVLTVLELLQTHGRISGPQLAARLEVDIRTVRRYIAMLQDIGIPIKAEIGRHGGYALRPGFKLPPLMFSNDEATAITLGLLLAQRHGLDASTPAVAGALAKLERVLPAAARTAVQALQATLTLDIAAPPEAVQSSVLATLSMAAQAQQQVQLRYSTRGDVTERTVDPYGVVGHDGHWYAVGYCHLRADTRVFRIDRVRGVVLGAQHFTRPPDFDPLAYLLRSFALIPDRWDVTVLLHTTLEQARRAVPASLALLEPQPDGVQLRASIDDLAFMARLLIGVGCPFVVHAPPALRAELRRIAAEIAQLAAEPQSTVATVD